MVITPAGPEGQVAFGSDNLHELVRNGNYRDLPHVAGETAAVHLPGVSDLILRWEETATTPALPQDPADLVDHLNGWYTPELRKLEDHGIPTEAHQSFVVSADDVPPVIFTAVHYSGRQPALYHADQRRQPSLSPERLRALQWLAQGLKSYLLRALDDGATSDTTIASIEDPSRYYGAPSPDKPAGQLTPILFKISHNRATTSDAVGTLTRLTQWERSLPPLAS